MKKLINIVFIDKCLTVAIKWLMFIAFIIGILFFSFTAQGCECPNQPSNGWDTDYPYHASALSVPSEDLKFYDGFLAYMHNNNCLTDQECSETPKDYCVQDSTGSQVCRKAVFDRDAEVNGQCLVHTNICIEAYNDLYWILKSQLPEICNGVGTCKAEIRAKYYGQF